MESESLIEWGLEIPRDYVIGMEGTAEVKVDERRILEFFLAPLVEYFDGSLKIK